MVENLLVGVFVGVVVFVISLSNSAKKNELKEKAKQDEFSKRLESLNKIIETEVSINTETPEKVEENKEVSEEVELVEKFKAKREKKKSVDNDGEVI